MPHSEIRLPATDGKLCVFCQENRGGKNRSREDYWPRWLWEHPAFAEAAQNRKSWKYGFISDVDYETNIINDTELPTIVQGRAVIHDKSVLICRKCNNEWMGNIQDSTKENCFDLFFGKKDFLDIDDQALIGKWATMTAMVIDSLPKTQPGVSKNTRGKFKKDQIVPSNATIMIAKHTGSKDCGMYRHHSMVAEDFEGNQSEILSAVTFSTGSLSFIFTINYAEHLMNFPTRELGLKLESLGFCVIHPIYRKFLSISNHGPTRDGIVSYVGHLFKVFSDENIMGRTARTSP